MQKAKFPTTHKPGAIYDASFRRKVIVNTVADVARSIDDAMQTLNRKVPICVLFHSLVDHTRRNIRTTYSHRPEFAKSNATRAEVLSALMFAADHYEFTWLKPEEIKQHEQERKEKN